MQSRRCLTIANNQQLGQAAYVTGKSSTLLAVVVMSCLSSCAIVPAPPVRPIAEGDELITLENEPGPFCGRCDSVKLTALSDGRVWIEHSYWAGRYQDWTTERKLVRVPTASFQRFRDHLSRYRPHGVLALNQKPPCATFWNDVDGARVAWLDRTGQDKLFLNFGCDPEAKKAEIEALKSAPALLGISTLRMPWGQWLATSPS